jgi:hypothetical protein
MATKRFLNRAAEKQRSFSIFAPDVSQPRFFLLVISGFRRRIHKKVGLPIDNSPKK